MNTTTRTARMAKFATALALVGTGLGALLVAGSTPSGADPKQFSALVGFGSDTTQDVVNALAGEANGNLYSPVRSSVASGRVQLTSWDATGSPCVTPKAPGATINRPNGSGAGIKALSRAIDGTNWGTSTCGIKPVSGLVDFARSSSGPTSGDLGTDLTYIPFGRDGVSFGYFANGVTPVTSLTRAQLTTIFTTAGSHIINGVDIVPCGIQTSSGTYKFWNTVTTATASTEDAATTACNNAAPAGRVQENDAAALAAKGASFAGKQVIVGFSAANFISQSNGVAASQLAAGVDLGSISDNGSGTNLGKPYTGTAPSLAPNSTFYSDGTFGRNVYHVVDTARATGFGNNDLKSLFVGSTSAVCQATSVIQSFGFLPHASCGSTTITGSLIAGQS